MTHHSAANASAHIPDERQLHCADPFLYDVQEGTYPHHCYHFQIHSWWSLQGTVHSVGMMTVYNTQKLEAFQHDQKQMVYRNAYKSLIIMVQQ
jgi:hypothetical protein